MSDGGKIEPAYLISKTCKRLCKNKLVISIPRQAKSAATLISLGADELHMGLLSELDEATALLGNSVVQEKSKEYYLGDIIYDFLNLVDIISKIFLKKSIRYVGGIENGFCFINKDEN